MASGLKCNLIMAKSCSPYDLASLVSILLGLSVVAPAIASPFASSPAATASASDAQRLAPYFSYAIDLDAYESNNYTSSSVEKRTNVNVCTKGAANAGVCVGVAGVLTQLGLGIATLLKGNSSNSDCSTHTGSIDNVQYSVYATGRNCDTTAQLNTIQGALNHFISSVDDDEICGVQCLRLTHGVTWTGYVLMGDTTYNLNNDICDFTGSFGTCASGGDGDA